MSGTDNLMDEPEVVKRTKHRSPNYPVMGLQKAVERAQQLHDKYKRATVPINLAQELWEYRPHGGSGNQAVAAMKAYGLLEVEGDGKARRVRLTDSAYRILMNSPDRAELLKKAAVAPAIHHELWERFKVEEHFPDDVLIRHYLLWDRPAGTFNAETVDGFIKDFRSSLRYSELLKEDIKTGQGCFAYVGDEEPLGPPPSTKIPGIGDLVQWSVKGKGRQYPQPRLVQGVSSDGKWVFIEGDPVPRPIDQVLVMVETADPVRGSQMPPVNPFAAPQQTLASATLNPGTAEEKKTLDEGPVGLSYPDKLSPESVAEFEYWIQGVIRRLRRKAGLPPGD